MSDKKDYFTINITKEIHYSLEICAQDYSSVVMTTQLVMEMYADIRDDPMPYLDNSNETQSEVGDTRHCRITHELK